jgi:hypothetical protein
MDIHFHSYLERLISKASPSHISGETTETVCRWGGRSVIAEKVITWKKM